MYVNRDMRGCFMVVLSDEEHRQLTQYSMVEEMTEHTVMQCVLESAFEVLIAKNDVET